MNRVEATISAVQMLRMIPSGLVHPDPVDGQDGGKGGVQAGEIIELVVPGIHIHDRLGEDIRGGQDRADDFTLQEVVEAITDEPDRDHGQAGRLEILCPQEQE